MSSGEYSEPMREKAVLYGATGWLDRLPELIRALEAEWNFTVGPPYSGGTESYVAQATQSDGTPAVLKLVIPRPGDDVRHEIAALRLINGEGCPRLLREDVGRSALLLERLGPSLYSFNLPLASRQEILCEAAGRLWRPAPAAGFPTGAEKARGLIDFITRIWQQLDRPCSERTVDYALECARRREAAHRDEQAVLVHGDVHQKNALQAGNTFKLTDPSGLLAEPEYDLGILMREDPEQCTKDSLMDRAAHLAQRTGLNRNAIWEWGVVERVSTGLFCLAINMHDPGKQMLQAAEAVSR